jgi:hypothetical protein
MPAVSQPFNVEAAFMELTRVVKDRFNPLLRVCQTTLVQYKLKHNLNSLGSLW